MTPTPKPTTGTPAPPLSAAAWQARWRRFQHVLHDLGILDLLGRSWVKVEGASLEFGALDDRASDALLRLLESIVAPPASTPSRAFRIQLLDETTRVAAPVTWPVLARPGHVAVGR